MTRAIELAAQLSSVDSLDCEVAAELRRLDAVEQAAEPLRQRIAELEAVEGWEPFGWQRRYLCPGQSPGIWEHCEERDVSFFAKRTDYELRRVYVPTRINHDQNI